MSDRKHLLLWGLKVAGLGYPFLLWREESLQFIGNIFLTQNKQT